MCPEFIMNISPKPNWPGVGSSNLVCACTRGVQENGAIELVVLQSTEILGLIICFAILAMFNNLSFSL